MSALHDVRESSPKGHCKRTVMLLSDLYVVCSYFLLT